MVIRERVLRCVRRGEFAIRNRPGLSVGKWRRAFRGGDVARREVYLRNRRSREITTPRSSSVSGGLILAGGVVVRSAEKPRARRGRSAFGSTDNVRTAYTGYTLGQQRLQENNNAVRACVRACGAVRVASRARTLVSGKCSHASALHASERRESAASAVARTAAARATAVTSVSSARRHLASPPRSPRRRMIPWPAAAVVVAAVRESRARSCRDRR